MKKGAKIEIAREKSSIASPSFFDIIPFSHFIVSVQVVSSYFPPALCVFVCVRVGVMLCALLLPNARSTLPSFVVLVEGLRS